MPLYKDGTVDEVWTSTSGHTKGKCFFGENKTAYYDESADLWSFGSTATYGAVQYALAATSDNIAYTCPAPLTALTNGVMVAFKMPAANSGASCTMNVNSLGAKKMYRSSDQSTQITTNDLVANGMYLMQYNTTLDTATGGWVVLNTPATSNFVDKTTAQTVAGVKTFTSNCVFDIFNYALAATADNIAYTLGVTITGLVNGAAVLFKMPAAASAGAVTLNVNSLGAKKVFLSGQVATQANSGDLEANALYIAVYDTSLDTASGGWIVFGAAVAQLRGNQTIAGNKTFSGSTVFTGTTTTAVTNNYALAVRASSGHFTAAVAITSLTPGATITIKMPAASDATSALAVNGLTEKKMLKMSDRSTQIGSADMASGGVYLLVYDDSVDSAAGAWLVAGL